tara:strand:- start:1156 stop:1509 length:354 start_codon:yes stop_codon:yes gene_type:complete
MFNDIQTKLKRVAKSEYTGFSNYETSVASKWMHEDETYDDWIDEAENLHKYMRHDSFNILHILAQQLEEEYGEYAIRTINFPEYFDGEMFADPLLEGREPPNEVNWTEIAGNLFLKL